MGLCSLSQKLVYLDPSFFFVRFRVYGLPLFLFSYFSSFYTRREPVIDDAVTRSRSLIEESRIGEVVKRFYDEIWPKMEHDFRQQVLFYHFHLFYGFYLCIFSMFFAKKLL